MLVSLLIMAIMAFFCALTPWVFDDFSYGAGGSSFSEMFVAQVNEHLHWSGKFIGHFMARVLLHGPTWLHPALTPVIFMGLVFSGVLLVLGAQWREKLRAWHVVTLAGLVWFALPAFGTVYFWRTGTPDYGYSLAFATAFLVPYRFWIDKKDYRLPGGPAFALAGFFAGCSNENVGMLVILTAICVAIYRFRSGKRVPLWAGSGIAGAIAGWLLMMTAPGNAVRLTSLGGAEKIPVLSLDSFNRFLTFWSSQELEMLPYVLIGIVAMWLLRRQGGLRFSTVLPGLIFFVMAQVSLAALVLSPSTPYRAMSATFFYIALCCFAFIVAWASASQGGGAKLLYAAFCAVLLTSVVSEAGVFIAAQPAIEARNKAMAEGTVTAKTLDYPATDKYFFPGYDIIEVDSYGPQKYQMVAWNEAVSLDISGTDTIRGLVVCNSVYLDNLPAGKVHVAAVTHRQTAASKIQAVLRRLAPLTASETSSTPAVTSRYAPASATVTAEGKAVLHIEGIMDLSSLAYVAISETGKPTVWRRVAARAAGTQQIVRLRAGIFDVIRPEKKN